MTTLKEVKAGISIKKLCLVKHNVYNATFYKFLTKYGDMELSDVKKLRELEDENRRLKQMSADLNLKFQFQK